MPLNTSISSEYRLQFSKDFTFSQATQLLGYFSELGITHILASPIFSSRAGSTHGYDVTDPTRLNPELGTEADFETFHQALRQRGMGLMLDIVPNHMSASTENSWWMDVLENGPDSAYASYFDIDWHPPSRSLDNRILLPILGRPFGEALDHKELDLTYLDGRIFVQYFDTLLPLAPKTYGKVLSHRIDQIKQSVGELSPAYQEYVGVAAAASALAANDTLNPIAVGDVRSRFQSVKDRLQSLVSREPAINHFFLDTLRDISGIEGHPSSFSFLETLLDQQFYVLAYWQNVNEEINYRRFFTITDLVGVRVENPLVFDATHALVNRLIERDILAGLRIDHIDGLFDPLAYLHRLNESIAKRPPSARQSIHIFVEKILAKEEPLPSDWPVAGTTGYDFLNALNRFFVHPGGGRRMRQIYLAFLRKDIDYNDEIQRKKKLVMATILGVEMRSLGNQLAVLARQDRYARDLSRIELTRVLIDITASLSVYRSYIRNLEVAPDHRKLIEHAVAEAQARQPRMNPSALDFVRDVLLLNNRPHLLPEQREARLSFVMRWQQFTGPIVAKAFEDTFLYIYNPLISLNEVGGDARPSTAALSDFSAFIQQRQKHWPQAINATTTHDTKRSEDVRARINVLSEIPDEWQTHLNRWTKANAPRLTTINGQSVPDRNEETFIYQTLFGMWPLDLNDRPTAVQRLQAYAVKATREAMVHTRWTKPNIAHEEALSNFIAAILTSGTDNSFLQDFCAFQKRIAYFGMLNGLSQTLLKIFCPGIPGFYQGSELWDLRLVDPDNRQPVDFQKRSAMLASIRQHGDPSISIAQDLTKNWHDGRIKLYLIWVALNFRKTHTDLSTQGNFILLPARGRRAENVAAFLRHHNNEWCIAAVPRWLANASQFPQERRENPRQSTTQLRDAHQPDQSKFWETTEIRLPDNIPNTWHNVLAGEQITATKTKSHRYLPVSTLLSNFPVALLSATAPS
ncbi:MAG TPA: malto-oligosyltrehalose synthase [Candidatus Acidoferrum sp.]|jgi:(1->4)-alpha-D-glucan 1-alpha-D-glucosylmutase